MSATIVCDVQCISSARRCISLAGSEAAREGAPCQRTRRAAAVSTAKIAAHKRLRLILAAPSLLYGPTREHPPTGLRLPKLSLTHKIAPRVGLKNLRPRSSRRRKVQL